MSELHRVVAASDLDAVKALLQHDGIDVNARDYTGALAFAPLHVAARRGDVKILRLLLSDARVDIEARDATKCTALRHAMGTGQLAAATELLVAGADAKNGLLPFIMLDGYNHLVAFLQKAITDLEAEVLPHRAMHHYLQLLLQRYNVLAPSPAASQQQQQQQAQQHRRSDTCRQQDQHQRHHPLVLKGVQRDAAELEAAAATIKQLRHEQERISKQISPAMCYAIVSLIKACRDTCSELGDADVAVTGTQ